MANAFIKQNLNLHPDVYMEVVYNNFRPSGTVNGTTDTYAIYAPIGSKYIITGQDEVVTTTNETVFTLPLNLKFYYKQGSVD